MAADRNIRTASGGPSALRQWIGLLGAPVVWLVHLGTNYALASQACRWATVLPLHIVSGTALALIAGIGALAWLNFEAAADEEPVAAELPRVSAGRLRLMGVVGMMTAILCFLIVIAQWLPIWTADPCRL